MCMRKVGTEKRDGETSVCTSLCASGCVKCDETCSPIPGLSISMSISECILTNRNMAGKVVIRASAVIRGETDDGPNDKLSDLRRTSRDTRISHREATRLFLCQRASCWTSTKASCYL